MTTRLHSILTVMMLKFTISFVSALQKFTCIHEAVEYFFFLKQVKSSPKIALQIRGNH
jgi:hypothetical protein